MAVCGVGIRGGVGTRRLIVAVGVSFGDIRTLLLIGQISHQGLQPAEAGDYKPDRVLYKEILNLIRVILRVYSSSSFAIYPTSRDMRL